MRRAYDIPPSCALQDFDRSNQQAIGEWELALPAVLAQSVHVTLVGVETPVANGGKRQGSVVTIPDGTMVRSASCRSVRNDQFRHF
jgi:hypothetical protein